MNRQDVTRSQIIATLQQLNDAENQSLALGLESKIAAIDATMAESVEGWSNGNHSPDRKTEQANEARLFQVFPDYQRSFDQVIVDPPFASVLWTIRGTAATNGFSLTMQGSSTFEFDREGKIQRAWVHTGQAPTPDDLGLEAQ